MLAPSPSQVHERRGFVRRDVDGDDGEPTDENFDWHAAHRLSHRNQVGKYAAKVMRSEFNRVNAQLSLDVQKAIEGHCIYLPNLLSPK